MMLERKMRSNEQEKCFLAGADPTCALRSLVRMTRIFQSMWLTSLAKAQYMTKRSKKHLS